MTLPIEIYHYILTFLDKQYSFSCVCKEFNELVRRFVAPTDNQVIQTFIKRLPLSAVKYIVDHPKSNLSVRNNFPFKICAMYGWVDAAKLLLSHINPSDVVGSVMRYGNCDIINLLLDHPSIKEVDISNAILSCSVSFIKKLINHPKVKVDDSALYEAVVVKNHELVRLFLKDPRIDIRRCTTIIYSAVISGDVEILQMLLLQEKAQSEQLLM